MKESIFYNKKQIKLIRRYWLIYKLIFEHGIRLFAWVFSILIVSTLLTSNYFSSLYLREKTNITEVKNQIEQEYTKRKDTITKIDGLKWPIIFGAIKTENSKLLSQDNLIEYKGLTFPRLINIEIEELNKISQIQSWRERKEEEFLMFLNLIIANPLDEKNLTFKNIEKKKLERKSLKEYFWLSCLDSEKKISFVCKSYMKDFFENIYALNLSSRETNSEKKENEEIYEGTIIGLNDLEFNSFAEVVGFSSPLDEYFLIYKQLNKNLKTSKDFCRVSYRYLQYGWETDRRFDEIFQRCNQKQLEEYYTLKEFIQLTRGLSLWYADSSVYNNEAFNTYKLYSLQQLLFRSLKTDEKITIILESYLGFLQELLQREKRTKNQLLNNFSKAFTIWFHNNILNPYLRENGWKLTSEERSRLITKLLLVNHGDHVRNMNGLWDKEKNKDQAREGKENITNIELLFKANLPKQFALLNIKKLDKDHLKIKGRDQKTLLNLEITLKFDGIQFIVQKVTITENKTLEEFINPLLKIEAYTLLRMLNLLEENINIVIDNNPIVLDLCKTMKAKYGKSLINCSTTQIQIQKAEEKEWEKWVIYTFILKNNIIIGIKVSDPNQELRILKTIDFSKFKREATMMDIEKILELRPEEKTSEFGLKEQLLVNDRFNKYLQIKPTKVDIKGWEVKVFFEIKDIKFIGNYDVTTDILTPIALNFEQARSPLIIEKFELIFKEDQQEKLTHFILDPIEYLKTINKKLVEKYFKEGKVFFEKRENK